MTAKRFLAWITWTAGGILIGFGMAFVAVNVAALFLPHCGAACDDSVPELVAAMAAYGAWILTAVTTSALAWRALKSG